MKQQIRLINEVQYADMFLNEERHYPKFLDNLKMSVMRVVETEIEKSVKNGLYNFETVIKIESEYCNEIDVKITLNPYGDINDRLQYQASYYNDNNSLQNGKLICPQLTIMCPFMNNRTDYFRLYYILAHELTHLYDDWKSLKCGKNSILLHQRNYDTVLFSQRLLKIGGDLNQGIGMLSYLSLKVERQAFLSQTIQELKGLGCTQFNYKDKMKETVFYGNLIKSYRLFYNGLSNVDNEYLISLNKWIIKRFPKASIPKYDIKTFNTEQYKQRLIKWANNIYHQTMKYYGSVVSYYIDELKEEWDKHTSMLII